MSNFTAAEGLSEKAARILEEMAESGDSQRSGVADILNTIAENGEGQEEDGFLATCAEEIRAAAQDFIDQVEGTNDKDKKVRCPRCSSSELNAEGSFFYEKGEHDGKKYEEEGYADLFACKKCGKRFALFS